MTNRARAALLVALASLAVALVACGDSEDTPPATTAPSNGAATSTAAPATPTPSGETVASTASIALADLPQVEFTTETGEAVTLAIEVPSSNEYSIGLSGRYELEDGRGMLFYYPPGDHTGAFWMRNTHIDLDIAFVDANMEVITVIRMFADTQDLHRPDRPYLAAIEARAGWYEEHGIGPGASAEFLFDVEQVRP